MALRMHGSEQGPLLEKKIGEVEFLRNNRPKFVSHEDKHGQYTLT